MVDGNDFSHEVFLHLYTSLVESQIVNRYISPSAKVIYLFWLKTKNDHRCKIKIF